MRPSIILASASAIAVVLAATAQAGVDQADFALTMDGPDSARVGGQATYQIALTNSGPDKVPAKVRVASGHGATSTDEGSQLKTVSQTTTSGSCKNDGRGVICRPGAVAPGETVRITVVAKVLGALQPELELQATVDPETPEAGTDPAKDNNHAELTTTISKPMDVQGLPDGCASKPFKLAVATAVVGAERTKVIIDGKVVGKSSKAKLKVTVKPKQLSKGNHKLSIVVQGAGGPPLATLKRTFKTC